MMKSTKESPDNWLNDYGDILYRFALTRVRSEATAEDLVQETLLAGLLAFDKFSGNSTVRTWLVGILKHKIIDHFRKHSREVSVLNNDESADDVLAYQFDQQGHWQVDLVEWSTPDKSIDNEQFQLAFNDCLTRLPQRMADLLLLRIVDGLAMEECCALLGFESDNQLWVTLSRTRVKLRQCLETSWFSKE
ncbi:MAG: sigma-70 family RNA polymerase sigma factor [Methyloprofundus sp.]|nr:sigma-70 family RNA polymerase sigma factor [Methyloprofundus sp.]MDT8426162.1 sigma-70 family RNA polymerase sigma factor [Methyloprofundus sp.]